MRDVNYFKKFNFYLIFFILAFSSYVVNSTEPVFTIKQNLWNNYGNAIGDIDGDGDFDFLVVFTTPLQHGGYCRVFINDGNANFIDSGQNLGIYRSHFVYLGDLDKDGDLDAIITGNTPTIYFNDGLGNFVNSGQTILSQSGRLEFLALGDLDNDGDLDFVNSDEGPKKLEVFLNDGNGLFESGGLFGLLWTHEVDLADADNDGDLDVGVSMNWGPTIIYYNNGAAQFTSSITLGDMAGKHVGPRFADFNNDGLVDLVEGYDQNPSTNRIYFNIGNRKFMDSGQRLGHYSTGYLTVGDIDNDGDIDIIENTGVIYLNDGNGFFTESFNNFYGGKTIGLADFDGDSDLDILSYHISLNNIADFNINTPPTEPQVIETIVDQQQVLFKWGKGNDSQSSAKLLTYNLRVGSSPGINDIFYAEIGPINTTPSFGNCWYTLKKRLILDDGMYYWSIQTVDPGFLRSNWSPEKIFFIGIVPAEVDLNPDTLNKKSNGKWVTAYIELPEGYHVDDIDVTKVALEYQSQKVFTEWGEPQGNLFMAKFSRRSLINILGSITDNVELKVTGVVANTPFEGFDTIRIK